MFDELNPFLFENFALIVFFRNIPVTSSRWKHTTAPQQFSDTHL